MLRRRFRSGQIALGLALLCSAGVVVAQIEGGNRGVAPIASSGTFEVAHVDVDASAPTADAARLDGWRLAQRKAWSMLAQRMGQGPQSLPDGTLDGLVSAIIVENEQIGPNRYIARLGVAFDRARAASILGLAGEFSRSAPMLLVPLLWSGGTPQVFEQRTPWQEAWARFRTGDSTIDYVRPTGTGPDPLLLNYGQVQRPGRGLWRTIIDQYGASDVLIASVRLYRDWPGGPVIGVFEARHGPDNVLLRRFSLRVANSDALPALLDEGAKRIDAVYQQALAGGFLKIDPALSHPPSPTPTPSDEPTGQATESADEDVTVGEASTTASSVTVQFDSPTPGSVSATESALRGTPGVSSASTSSLALGGVSVMRVSYAGDPAALAAALQARGWQVTQAGDTLRIHRAAPAPGPAPGPSPSASGEPSAG